MADDLPRPFGPYVLLSSLGKGAAGEAFLARPHDESRGVPTPVVIKLLHQRLADDAEFVKRFKHEAHLAVRVDSPHIAAVYDVGSVGDTLYIALEYVPGVVGSKFLGRIVRRRIPVPHDIASAYVIQGLHGLYSLYTAKNAQGESLEVVHRDVSPKNLMVGDDGVVRLIDLGIGKSKDQDWQTRQGRVMGSPGYMAPEQIRGETVDHRADVYAFGVILHEMLARKRWVDIKDPVQMLREGLKKKFEPTGESQALDPILERAMARERDARFTNAAEMIAAIEEACAPADDVRLGKFIESVLPKETRERRAEVDRLLSLTFQPPDEPELERTVVMAARTGIGAVQMPAARPLSLEVPPPPSFTGSYTNNYSDLRSGFLPPKKSPLPLALGLTAAFAAGVVATVFYMDRNTESVMTLKPDPAVHATPTVAEPTIAEPTVSVAARPEVRPEPVQKVAPPRPVPQTKRGTKMKPTKRPAAQPKPVVADPPPVTEPPRQRLQELMKRANAKKNGLPPADPRRRTLQRLLIDMTAEKSSGSVTGAKVDSFEASFHEIVKN